MFDQAGRVSPTPAGRSGFLVDENVLGRLIYKGPPNPNLKDNSSTLISISTLSVLQT